MNTFSMMTSKNINVTPVWMTSERYNFTESMNDKKKSSFQNMIQKLFRR